MKILVTGSSGLLGRYVLNELKEKQHEIIVLKHENQVENIQQIQLDITDKNSVVKNISKIDIDGVIHCAANADIDFCEANKEIAEHSNQFLLSHQEK